MKRSPLKRKTPMRRGKGPRRSKRVKPRNDKRRAESYRRNYGGPDGDHADHVRSRGCVCDRQGIAISDANTGELLAQTPRVGTSCSGQIEAAHVVPRGMGGRGGGWADIVGLCHRHHVEAGEWRTSQRAEFEARHHVDLREEADRLAAPRIITMVAVLESDPAAFTGYDIEAVRAWQSRNAA